MSFLFCDMIEIGSWDMVCNVWICLKLNVIIW